jgi:Ca2+-binding EF-hand superfamily protein
MSMIGKVVERFELIKSDSIDFGEFVMANIDLKKVVNENRLMQIFTLVDKDGSGTISKEELIQFFNIGSDNESQKFIQNMVDEADKNGDGEISFQEFLDVMKELHKKM